MTSPFTVLREARQILAKSGLTGLTGAGFDYVTRPLLQPAASRTLRRRASGKTDPGELVDLVLDFKFGNVTIRPQQVRSEIRALVERLQALKPATVLEIGTARGGTLFLFSRIATADAHLISVDLPFGQFGGGYPGWRAGLYRNFALPPQRITLLRQDSHDARTVREVSHAFGERPVDFLFIDGDHSYDGVKADYEMYGPLVRPGGLIAFHDIVPGDAAEVGGVPAFWQDLKTREHGRRPVSEFVESWQQGGFGIGLLG